MCALIAKRGDSGEQVPDGVFMAKVIGTEDKGVQDYGFGPKQYFNLIWEVYSPGAAPMKLKELFNLNFDLKSNLFKRVFSILNMDPGASFDVATMVGTVRQIVVQNQPDKKGILRSRVSAVLPATPQPAAAAAPVAVTPAPAAAAPVAAPVQDRAQDIVDQLRAAQARSL